MSFENIAKILTLGDEALLATLDAMAAELLKRCPTPTAERHGVRFSVKDGDVAHCPFKKLTARPVKVDLSGLISKERIATATCKSTARAAVLEIAATLKPDLVVPESFFESGDTETLREALVSLSAIESSLKFGHVENLEDVKWTLASRKFVACVDTSKDANVAKILIGFDSLRGVYLGLDPVTGVVGPMIIDKMWDFYTLYF